MQVEAKFDLSKIIPQHTKFVLVMLPKGCNQLRHRCDPNGGGN
jgi:hypothetical protein